MTAFFGNSQLLQWRRKYTKNHETSRRSKRGNLSWCVCPLVFAAPGNRGQEINSDIATWCLASSPPEIKKGFREEEVIFATDKAHLSFRVHAAPTSAQLDGTNPLPCKHKLSYLPAA